MKTKDHLPPWCKTEFLPSHDGTTWAIWHKGTATGSNLESVRKLPTRSLIGSSTLIGQPGSTRFVPAACVTALHRPVAQKVLRHQCSLILGPLLIVAAMLAISFRFPTVLNIALVFSLFPLIMAFDYLFALRHIDSYADRVLFLRWVYDHPGGIYLWTGVALAIGMTQFLAMELLGGQEGAFRVYGTLYPAVTDGEWWRLATGPFLHYSFAHYLVNVVLLVLVGWMTWPILGCLSVSVFVFGNILGAAGQLLWGGTLYDNVAGISAGVYALFGLLAGAAAIDKKLYPKGFGIVYGSVAVMAIAYSEVVSGDAATVAHLMGLGSGLLIGAAWGAARTLHPKAGPKDR